MQILDYAFILMDVLNVNYDQDDIHFHKQDAYNFIRQEKKYTYKGILNPSHFRQMYFELDKKNDITSYLYLSY